VEREPHNQTFTLAVARRFVAASELPPEVAEALVAAAEAPPGASDWRSFLSWFLAFAGVALALSGVIFFFAYNWAALGKFSKLGLLEFAIVAAALGAWRLGDRLWGGVLLLIAVVLVGPLLAVYGQTYQTGADPYELFLGWIGLTLPWVVLARSPALWMFSLVLVDVAFVLFWQQVLAARHDIERNVPAMLALTVLNTSPWALWELLHRRGIAWLSTRWAPRFMGVVTNATFVWCLVLMIVDEARQAPGYDVSIVFLSLGIVAASVHVYRNVIPDLFMLALSSASVMTVVTVGVGRILFSGMDAEIGGVFVLGLLVVAQVAGAATWLRSESRRMNHLQQPMSPRDGVTS